MTNPSCPGCGHIYYTDAPVRGRLCKYCVEEDVEKCIYCGRPATCLSEYGYLCGDRICSNREDVQRKRDYLEKYGE